MDFIFIASYWALYASMSFLLMQRSITGGRLLAVAAIASATTAAWFDLREDSTILNLLRAPTPLDDLVAAIRHASLSKWCFVFVATILVSLVFVPRRDFATVPGKIFTIIGILLGTGGVAGLSGLFVNRLIPLAILMTSSAALSCCIAFWSAPDAFLGNGHFRARVPKTPAR